MGVGVSCPTDSVRFLSFVGIVYLLRESPSSHPQELTTAGRVLQQLVDSCGHLLIPTGCIAPIGAGTDDLLSEVASMSFLSSWLNLWNSLESDLGLVTRPASYLSKTRGIPGTQMKPPSSVPAWEQVEDRSELLAVTLASIGCFGDN